jgi:hypothetical protein
MTENVDKITNKMSTKLPAKCRRNDWKYRLHLTPSDNPRRGKVPPQELSDRQHKVSRIYRLG